ncbi:MAG: uroporphyrinogen-III synthase [Bacteroidales bacterium]|jgi:uroporphyrinogen-III synthase|nr:uroporphyrinogen-III synthase [Bacteroidales bacterium]MDD2823859.1 uroporphyrinogen-III synthase [Bacteroidales bacterium]MDD3100342.1 uroporphyrinogen-III synthase [Bacteroidales bacterium]MDD3639221.1 uroporphyrinogen-III synthase [Bacteroidales bacterium]MDD3943912.1 uroporphyrinogen-III synthase [Bacteroidales bacterium]
MKIRNILISQPTPNGCSPYVEVKEKFGLHIDFVPFIRVEGLTAKDFRTQRVNILDHTAVVFTSRSAIDSFFHLCEELRINIPETMKYFCMTEAVAFYLQKYIVYRKRKIFFGKGNIPSLVESIGPKHKNEKFLLTLADCYKPELPLAFEKAGFKFTKAILTHTIMEDLSGLDLKKYQMLVFYSPADVRSLLENFPEFSQDGILFGTFGNATASALKEASLQSCFEAPTPEAPSIAQALTLYLEKNK